MVHSTQRYWLFGDSFYLSGDCLLTALGTCLPRCLPHSSSQLCKTLRQTRLSHDTLCEMGPVDPEESKVGLFSYVPYMTDLPFRMLAGPKANTTQKNWLFIDSFHSLQVSKRNLPATRSCFLAYSMVILWGSFAHYMYIKLQKTKFRSNTIY